MILKVGNFLKIEDSSNHTIFAHVVEQAETPGHLTARDLLSSQMFEVDEAGTFVFHHDGDKHEVEGLQAFGSEDDEAVASFDSSLLQWLHGRDK